MRCPLRLRYVIRRGVQPQRRTSTPPRLKSQDSKQVNSDGLVIDAAEPESELPFKSVPAPTGTDAKDVCAIEDAPLARHQLTPKSGAFEFSTQTATTLACGGVALADSLGDQVASVGLSKADQGDRAAPGQPSGRLPLGGTEACLDPLTARRSEQRR